MNSFTEKKWFVYLGDHHEGPHSTQEIQTMIDRQKISKETYVWAENLVDWKIITEVQELVGLFKDLAAPSRSNPPPFQKMNDSQSIPDLDISSPLLPLLESVPDPEPILESVSSGAAVVPVLEQKAHSQLIEKVELERSKGTSYEGRFTKKDTKTDLFNSQIPSQQDRSSLLKRAAGHLLHWSGRLMVLGVVVGVWILSQNGYFNSVLQSPGLQATANTANDLIRPLLETMADHIPILTQWISPLPVLDDVSIEEYEDLKSAARQKQESGVNKAAIALSKADPLNPFFYISSNLPDGAQFKIYLLGVPDTLLNQLSFNALLESSVTKKLGKSKIVRFSDGKPIPKGEYKVLLTTSEKQTPEVKTLINSMISVSDKPPTEISQNEKLLVIKTYFLGGAKDENYSRRLKEFHDRLWKKADDEIREINQFVSTFESQLISTQTKFESLHKGKLNILQKRDWEKFHNNWMSLEGNLHSSFPKWTPEAIKNEYFYGSLYQLIEQFGQSVEKVHGFHHAYFVGNQDSKTFEIQLGEATSSAHNVLAQLKAKVSTVERTPKATNGVPNREAL